MSTSAVSVAAAARAAAVGLLGVAYVVGSHWLMTRPSPSPWDAVGLLTPMLAAAALTAWHAGQRWRAVAALAGVAALCWQALVGVVVPAPWLYLGQHVAVHLLLALWFASTLRPGALPLISELAKKLHGTLSPGIAAYTRNVTRVWVGYFVGMAVLSAVLFGSASFDHWAVFANLLTPLSLGALFVGERLVRYRLHPEFERTSLLDAVRAYSRPAASAGAALPSADRPA